MSKLTWQLLMYVQYAVPQKYVMYAVHKNCNVKNIREIVQQILMQIANRGIFCNKYNMKLAEVVNKE